MGCVNSVEDKKAAGTWAANKQGQASGHWQADAAAAVAELLGASFQAEVEISVKCFKLPDKDVFSKSDPMVVLRAGDSQGQTWSEVDRSDVVANSLNPEFPRPLRCTYVFEKLQPMRLVAYDVDVEESEAAKLKLEQQDFLAEGSFLLSDLLTSPGQTMKIQLADRQGRPIPGCMAQLSAEELPNTNAVVSLSLAATKLENKDVLSKSDPFVLISKARENGAWVPVLKTEVIDNNLNPVWRPFQASMAQLCNCDPHRPLLLEVLDSDSSGSHDFIGHCQATLQQLQDAAKQGQGLPLVNPKKVGKPGYTCSGTLLVKAATVVPRPSFLEYIKGGMQLNFLVAVDYTASNGDPRDPAALHFITANQPSLYEEAISAVGHVLEHYDSDKLFPSWGFGAALPPSGTVSHNFPLNGDPGNPEVAGVQGILQAYRQTLTTVRLSGPTLFAPLIAAAAQIAAQPTTHLEYFVLLILTDGCIMDMAATLTALVNASQLPLSLLIVGVGNADFTAMETLDGDEHRVKAPDGRLAARDFVQFVPFRPQQRDTVEVLTAKLLAELPGQVVEYFHDMCHIAPPATSTAPPMPPPAVSFSNGQANGVTGPANGQHTAAHYPNL